MSPRKEFISFLKRRPNWVHQTIDNVNQIYVQSARSEFILQTEKKQKYVGMTVIGYLNPSHVICYAFMSDAQIFEMKKLTGIQEVGNLPFWYKQTLYVGSEPHAILQYSQHTDIYSVVAPHLYDLVYAMLEIRDPEVIESMRIYHVFDEKYQLQNVALT